MLQFDVLQGLSECFAQRKPDNLPDRLVTLATRRFVFSVQVFEKSVFPAWHAS